MQFFLELKFIVILFIVMFHYDQEEIMNPVNTERKSMIIKQLYSTVLIESAQVNHHTCTATCDSSICWSSKQPQQILYLFRTASNSSIGDQIEIVP